jgi:hypothetical protein
VAIDSGVEEGVHVPRAPWGLERREEGGERRKEEGGRRKEGGRGGEHLFSQSYSVISKWPLMVA